MKSLEALEDIITIYSNIVSTNRCAGKTRFEKCVRQIKQDLEVLEILKRRIKFTYSDHFNAVIIEGKEENYDKDTVIFSQEEYEKIYEWLEEQE